MSKLDIIVDTIKHPDFTLSNKRMLALGTDMFGDVVTVGLKNHCNYFIYANTIHSLRWTDWFKVLWYQIFGGLMVRHYPMI